MSQWRKFRPNEWLQHSTANKSRQANVTFLRCGENIPVCNTWNSALNAIKHQRSHWLYPLRYTFRKSILCRYFILSHCLISFYEKCSAWWCNDMDAFSALLAMCEGNQSFTSGFTHKGPVMRCVGVCHHCLSLFKNYVSPMLTSSNGNIFRVTGSSWGESTGHRWIPHKRPVTQSFDVRLNTQLSKQSIC